MRVCSRTSRAVSCASNLAFPLPVWSCGRRSRLLRTRRRLPACRLESTVPRAMEITTPLGSDVLLFHTMHAREELSRVGEWRLDLLSLKSDINLDEILGKSVTVKVALQDDATRYFNGYVTRFSQGGTYGRYRRYYAVVNPWLWFLSRTADCRIFQDKTVPEILKAVFADHSTASVEYRLSGSYAKWIYCVQYRETDLNFVCR